MAERAHLSSQIVAGPGPPFDASYGSPVLQLRAAEAARSPPKSMPRMVSSNTEPNQALLNRTAHPYHFNAVGPNGGDRRNQSYASMAPGSSLRGHADPEGGTSPYSHHSPNNSGHLTPSSQKQNVLNISGESTEWSPIPSVRIKQAPPIFDSRRTHPHSPNSGPAIPFHPPYPADSGNAFPQQRQEPTMPSDLSESQGAVIQVGRRRIPVESLHQHAGAQRHGRQGRPPHPRQPGPMQSLRGFDNNNHPTPGRDSIDATFVTAHGASFSSESQLEPVTVGRMSPRPRYDGEYPKYSSEKEQLRLADGQAEIVVASITTESLSSTTEQQISPDVSIHEAALQGNIYMLKAFISQGAPLNSLKEGLSPLHVSVIGSQADSVELLSQSGADVNQRDVQGFTALHTAAGFGSVDIARSLLKNGADISALDNEGNTPLHCAVARDDYAMCETLLELGADSCIRSANGNTPVDLWNGANRVLGAILYGNCSNLKAHKNLQSNPTHNQRSQPCLGCLDSLYCSQECQSKDWARHRFGCSNATNFTQLRAAIQSLGANQLPSESQPQLPPTLPSSSRSTPPQRKSQPNSHPESQTSLSGMTPTVGHQSTGTSSSHLPPSASTQHHSVGHQSTNSTQPVAISPIPLVEDVSHNGSVPPAASPSPDQHRRSAKKTPVVASASPAAGAHPRLPVQRVVASAGVEGAASPWEPRLNGLVDDKTKELVNPKRLSLITEHLKQLRRDWTTGHAAEERARDHKARSPRPLMFDKDAPPPAAKLNPKLQYSQKPRYGNV